MNNYIYTYQNAVLIITADNKENADDILESIVSDVKEWRFDHNQDMYDLEPF